MSSKKRLHTILNTVYLIEEHVYLARGLEEFFPHKKWLLIQWSIKFDNN